MLLISFLVYMPGGIYCSSVSEDSSPPLIHPWKSMKVHPGTTSTLIAPPIHTGAVTGWPRKKLPVGSDFKFIITKNMIYVDKTDIIHDLIEKTKYVFLSRPPRFGKSLLVSTLRYLFEGNKSNERLFEGMKIKNTIGYKFPVHTVLLFDFSELDCKSGISFRNSLCTRVGEFFVDYGINKQGCDLTLVKECMAALLRKLNKNTGRKNVVLVDEYDHPWRNFQGDQKDREVMLKYMREFFTVLKSNDASIEFCFVTGSTKIALTKFFSGYNCAIDISWFPEYETIVGFSERELREYFHEYVEEEAKHKNYSSPEVVYRFLNDKFEGFRFSQRKENMYNSQELVDYFSSSAKDSSTYQKKAESKYVVTLIQKIPEIAIAFDLMNELSETHLIPVGMDFIRGFKDQFNDAMMVLKVLYEGGILSIKDHKFCMDGGDQYFIGFTNEVSRHYYHSLIKGSFPDFPQLAVTSDPGLKEPLQNRDIDTFLQKLDSHFMEVPYYLTKNVKEPLVEAIFQVVLFYGLRLSQMQPNWETVLQIGRLDLRTVDDDTVYTFELKRESNWECETIMEQCEDYSRSPFYRDKRVVCIGIVFHNIPVQTRKAIAAWGLIEKSPNGTFVPEWNTPALYEFTRRSSLRKNNG